MTCEQRAALKAQAEAVATSPLPSPLGIAATAQQARDMLALLAALQTAERERDEAREALASAMAEKEARTQELARASLLRLMEDLSEGYWCAGWLNDLEWLLWHAVLGQPVPWFDRLKAEEAEKLRQLAADAGGWWVWDDATPEGHRFLARAEWEPLFAVKSEEIAARERAYRERKAALPPEPAPGAGETP